VSDHAEFTMIDLFCAPGGLSLGFEMAGFRTVAGVDRDKDGMKTYAANFSHAKAITADVTRLESDELMKIAGIKRGEIDLIIGGPPCQGFSNIGRVKIASLVREGTWKLSTARPRFIDDPRNVLYKEFVRIVRDLRPKFFVMENVPGMRSYRNGEIVNEILGDFGKIGYRAQAKVLNAVNYGVPQRRKRIFFIGTRLEEEEIPWPKPQNYDPEATEPTLDYFLGSNSGAGPDPPITVWDAIGDLPDPVPGKTGLADLPLEYDRDAFSEYQEWAREGSEMVHNHITRQHNERDIRVFGMMKEGTWWKDLPDDIKRLYGYRDDIFHDKMKRLCRKEPSWTVVAHLYKDGYMYIHPVRPRSITVREAARLQSFPDTFIFRGSRTAQFKQVGNAVPPLMAKAVAVELKRVLEKLVSSNGGRT